MTTLFYKNRPVADLPAETGEARLIYRSEWLQAAGTFPISLSMPLRQEAWPSDRVTPWLMNLLPEGEPFRAMTRALGMSADDILGLISETGGDLAGALRVGAPRVAENPDVRIIRDAAALEQIIEALPRKPFLVGDAGVSMSLAGAQEKLPVVAIEEKIGIPVNGAPSTHILKPDNSRLPGSVQNEALCMVLARRCGLSVAPVTTGVAGARTFLLVERYDRRIEENDVARIHQEDFCQALSRPPAAKYERSGPGVRGVSLAEMFDLVRGHMTARDITRLLDAVIFNVAIGNVDSHAKNYSILLEPGRGELAPLYDLMSGLAWGGITENHAQLIGNQRRGRHIHARHWRRMAQACGLAQPATVRRVLSMTARVLKELPAAAEEVERMPAGPGAMLPAFVEVIEARARVVGDNARNDATEGADEAQADDEHPQGETYANRETP